MAISPCDNFSVFVLACHSGFLERYFSTIVFVICAGKIKFISELAAWADSRGAMRKKRLKMSEMWK